jgi:hypothetical protein
MAFILKLLWRAILLLAVGALTMLVAGVLLANVVGDVRAELTLREHPQLGSTRIPSDTIDLHWTGPRIELRYEFTPNPAAYATSPIGFARNIKHGYPPLISWWRGATWGFARGGWGVNVHAGVVLATALIACVAGVLIALRRRARPRAGRCDVCGYNLTGNVSGRCPECGTMRTSH